MPVIVNYSFLQALTGNENEKSKISLSEYALIERRRRLYSMQYGNQHYRSLRPSAVISSHQHSKHVAVRGNEQHQLCRLKTVTDGCIML